MRASLLRVAALRLFNTTPAVHGDKVAAALDGARGRPVTSIPIEVPLALCEAAPRARAIDDGAVRVLAASIAETGLLSPITVRRAISSRSGEACEAFEVVAGLHRVKADEQVEFLQNRVEVFLADAGVGGAGGEAEEGCGYDGEQRSGAECAEGLRGVRIARVTMRAHAGLIIIIPDAAVKLGGCGRECRDDGDGAV